MYTTSFLQEVLLAIKSSYELSISLKAETSICKYRFRSLNNIFYFETMNCSHISNGLRVNFEKLLKHYDKLLNNLTF